jgi:3D (Asp-Asp-Asp) domain-containing protein
MRRGLALSTIVLALLPLAAAPTPATETADLRVARITFYSRPDNDPPGSAAIAYPGVHETAGGAGTYGDPVTFAVSEEAQDTFPPGSKVCIPYLERYVIMEDLCGAYDELHLDVWLESLGGDDDAVRGCQYALTRDDDEIEIDPPPDRPVSPEPLFDHETVTCYSPD